MHLLSLLSHCCLTAVSLLSHIVEQLLQAHALLGPRLIGNPPQAQVVAAGGQKVRAGAILHTDIVLEMFCSSAGRGRQSGVGGRHGSGRRRHTARCSALRTAGGIPSSCH